MLRARCTWLLVAVVALLCSTSVHATPPSVPLCTLDLSGQSLTSIDRVTLMAAPHVPDGCAPAIAIDLSNNQLGSQELPLDLLDDFSSSDPLYIDLSRNGFTAQTVANLWDDVGSSVFYG